MATAGVTRRASAVPSSLGSAPAGEGETINLDALSQIENYKEILKKDPNNLQALVNIGNLYFDTRQDLLAIEHYRKALGMDPRNVNVRTDMAVCFRRAGNPDRAVEELKKAARRLCARGFSISAVSNALDLVRNGAYRNGEGSFLDT